MCLYVCVCVLIWNCEGSHLQSEVSTKKYLGNRCTQQRNREVETKRPQSQLIIRKEMEVELNSY